MLTNRRTVFFISDSTAITAETLGHSLLTQFDHVIYDQVTLPFIDTLEKASHVVHQINLEENRTGMQPLVFSTLINREVRQAIMGSRAKCFDLFDTFILRLEKELSMESAQLIGRYHGVANAGNYDVRIEAVNYALGSDDGICTKSYDRADIILTGVSRAGKTPTCLYLGLQFGIFAANYPLTEEDLFGQSDELPTVLAPFRRKLFGLTINPERLQKIRSERRPESRYASLGQCQKEISSAEYIFQSKQIPFLNVTTMSVEEIAATVLHDNKLERRLW